MKIRQVVWVGTAAALLAALTSCSSLTSGLPASPPRDAPAQLLALGDLPEGWSTYTPTGNDSTECMPNEKYWTEHSVSYGAAQFHAPNSNAVLAEEIWSFDLSDASANFTDAITVLNGCTTLSYQQGSVAVRGYVGSMSFPVIADESTAYDMELSADGGSYSYRFVLFRKKHEIGLVGLLDNSSSAITTLKGAAMKAASKISG